MTRSRARQSKPLSYKSIISCDSCFPFETRLRIHKLAQCILFHSRNDLDSHLRFRFLFTLIHAFEKSIHSRNRTRLTNGITDPDQYTVIAAPLKILKVLIVELQSASGSARELDAQAAAELAEEGSNDDDWEDEPNPFLELSGGLSKEQLMAFGAEDGPGTGRQRDDETQAFLVDFFKRASGLPGFTEEWEALSTDEQARLRESAN